VATYSLRDASETNDPEIRREQGGFLSIEDTKNKQQPSADEEQITMGEDPLNDRRKECIKGLIEYKAKMRHGAGRSLTVDFWWKSITGGILENARHSGVSPRGMNRKN